MRENIDWTFIEFSDNQKCIEMIEAKIGILSLLDEESRLPSGSDQGFCNKLYSNFGSADYQDYFKKPRFSNAAFTVVHYAHDVQYEAEGFLEKNKDSVPDEHLNLLQNSEFSFLADMIQRSETIGATPSPANGGVSYYHANFQSSFFGWHKSFRRPTRTERVTSPSQRNRRLDLCSR